MFHTFGTRRSRQKQDTQSQDGQLHGCVQTRGSTWSDSSSRGIMFIRAPASNRHL